jgi:stage II sporulation protein AA (anti-sigma F factor antagonist)
MTLAIEKIGDILVVSLEGQINSGNAAALEADLLSQLDKGEQRIVLDLTNLNYISSAGLRVVLVLAKRLKQSEGALTLCGMQPHVLEVFDISGFLAILVVTATREEALHQVASNPAQEPGRSGEHSTNV